MHQIEAYFYPIGEIFGLEGVRSWMRIQPVNATQTPIPLCCGLGPACEAKP
jgi:hypothetical protein